MHTKTGIVREGYSRSQGISRVSTAFLGLGQVNPLKRTRVTCGEVGVSPDIARARPSSKLSRKILVFDCKWVYRDLAKAL